MKTLISALTFVVLFCSLAYCEDSSAPFVSVDRIYPLKSRLAFTIGTPAGFQLNFSYWGPRRLGYRLTAGAMAGAESSHAAGFQAEITERISRNGKSVMDVSFGVGYSSIYVDYEDHKWTYAGGFWTLNSHGFFLQSGLTVGDGYYDSPQFFLQIGFSLFSTHRR